MKEGEIYLNTMFGDLWIVIKEKGKYMYLLINTHQIIPIDEPEGFVKIGEITKELKTKNINI